MKKVSRQPSNEKDSDEKDTMETFGTQYSESLISSLNYTLGRTSSAIQDRREVKIKPRGATEYSPGGATTIEFTITDSSAYLLLNTVKLQFK